MYADRYGFRFLTLERYVVLDEVGREHAAFRQELTVRLERVERFVQGARHAANFSLLFVGQLVDVLVERTVTERLRINLALDAVQTGQQHCSEGQVRVSRGVRRTELDAAALRRYGCNRNTNGCGTVALREYQVNWCFVARNETLE